MKNLSVLLLLIFFDYLSGICAAIYEKKINSTLGRKGILNKIGILICVFLCKIIDLLSIAGFVPIFPIITLFFSINEVFSILENLVKLNVPIPDLLISMLETIQKKLKK